jgi:hypothetical protein
LESKDMGSGAFRGKMAFLGGSGVFLEFLEWLEGLGANDRGSYEIWEFFRDFCGLFGEFKGLRT